LLGERIVRVTVSSIYLSVLYKIMLQDDCEFLDVRAGGRVDHPLYFHNYPCQKIPDNLDNFYIFKLAYHTYELIYSLIFHRKRVDFPEYVLHHFLTFALIFTSYTLNYLPIGSIVMLLHDITDLCMSIFKLSSDVTPMIVQFLTYSLMVVPWIYFRLWFFTVHVIGRIYEEIFF
jgi:ceramide synthetase